MESEVTITNKLPPKHSTIDAKQTVEVPAMVD
jgi:hypothetical protein